MKGDFTRFTFQPKKHYTGVYMQQGRLQLDSDWNEQVAIQKHLIQTYAKDLIGGFDSQGSGVPVTKEKDENFEIRLIPDKQDFIISQGHIYVNGILCEHSNGNVNYTKQDDHPDALKADLGKDGLRSETKETAYFYIAYLDVWERHVTSLDDPEICEVALNGMDTATRTKTVWQVKLMEVSKNKSEEEDWADFLRTKLEEFLNLKWKEFLNKNDNRTRKAFLTATKTDGLSPENRLYRLEIHKGGQTGEAIFKWSRNNASIFFAVKQIKGNIITVNSRGHDISQAFEPGQWIEVIDESREKNNQPGTLVQVSNVMATSLEIDLNTANGDAVNSEKYPILDGSKTGVKIRRWEHAPNSPDKALYSTGTNVPLEAGIEVTFGDASSHSQYQTGDYWLLPVRANQQVAEWSDKLLEEPNGIHHNYLRLASSTFNGKTFEPWKDHRVLFPSLTDCISQKDGLKDLERLSIGSSQELATLEVQSVDPKPLEQGIFTVDPEDTTIVRLSFPQDNISGGDLQNLQKLQRGTTIIASNQENTIAKTITQVDPDGVFYTYRIDSPFGLALGVNTAYSYQLPIARFADSSSTTQVIITAQGNLGIGTEAPTADLAVQGHSDQQPIARFSRLQADHDQTKVIITAEGKLGIGTDAPEAELQVVGKLKTDSLELPPQGTFKAGTFIANQLQLQNRSEQIYGFIQVYPLEKAGNKEIRFAANKDQGINFAFLDGDIRIAKSGDTPASLRLNQGVAVTQFSNTFTLPPGSDPAAIVPTIFAVSEQLDRKAALHGSLQEAFNAQNLTVKGTLKFDQKGVGVTEFSNTFTLPPGSDSATVVPTMFAVSNQISGKAALHGSLQEPFNTQNLTVKGTLKFDQKGVEVTEFSNTFTLPNGSDLQTAVPTIHAIAEYANQQLSIKADKSYVDQKLVTKVDQAYVDNSLATKADQTYVDQKLTTKVDKAYVDNQVLIQANKNRDSSQDFNVRDLLTRDLKVQGALTLLKGVKINEFSAIDLTESARSDLAVATAKATKDYVDQRLLTKVEQEYVDQHLLTKANKIGDNKVDFSARNLTVNGLTIQDNLTLKGTNINQFHTTLTSGQANNQALPTAQAVINYATPLGGSLQQNFQTKDLTITGTVTAQGTVVIGSSGGPPEGAPIPDDAKLYVKGKAFAQELETTRISQISSRALKENIAELSSQEVTELLKGLKPVKYSFKADEEERLHAGFLSEEVPDLVTSSDRNAINPVDIVAILTKAVQDQRQTTMVLANIVDRQQQEIRRLQEQINLLGESSKNKSWFR